MSFRISVMIAIATAGFNNIVNSISVSAAINFAYNYNPSRGGGISGLCAEPRGKSCQELSYKSDLIPPLADKVNLETYYSRNRNRHHMAICLTANHWTLHD